ncbi:MAG: exonuclease domain-containing protein [Patescibacteria group bacterium]|mgnify:FL=1
MIVVDVESSGVDPIKHSVLSIGAIDFSNPKNQFYGECRVWDGAHIMDEALVVNGFTKEQITDSEKQTEELLIKSFLLWANNVDEHTIAGQNPSFDRDFIHRAAERSHINWPLAYRTIDLHTACYFHMVKRGLKPPVANKRTDLNSDKIMKYVGIPAEIRPHNALNGAKVATEAFSRLFYDKAIIDEYKGYAIPW